MRAPLQKAVAEHQAGVPPGRRVVFRIGVNLGDVVVEGEDLLGDGVNVAARLEQLCEPGGVLVSGTAYDQLQGKLAGAPLEFAGEWQVKNIARPVRAYRMLLDGGRSPEWPALPLPDKPSLAVLPFENLSRDPEQGYFADGIVEDIITALSRAKWLFVIARHSSFAYRGKAMDVRQVGRELGVRYVLEGSVRKAGKRVRITGQLIDAQSGAHLWADRFEGTLADVFELQDRVAQGVAGAIEPTLRGAEIERARRKPTESLGAYDLYLRALQHPSRPRRQTTARRCGCSSGRWPSTRITPPHLGSRPGATSTRTCAVGAATMRPSGPPASGRRAGSSALGQAAHGARHGRARMRCWRTTTRRHSRRWAGR